MACSPARTHDDQAGGTVVGATVVAVVPGGTDVEGEGARVVDVVGCVVDGGTREVDVVVACGLVAGGVVGRTRVVGGTFGLVDVGNSTGTTLRVTGSAAGRTSTYSASVATNTAPSDAVERRIGSFISPGSPRRSPRSRRAA